MNRLPKTADADGFGKFLPGKSKPMMAMMEITNRCNMACPICFSDANGSTGDIPLADARKYLEHLLEVTETPIPIQISGGEPTLHEKLPEIIAAAKRLGYRHIELVTNGIKIADEPKVLHTLKAAGLSAVYLQFDGLNKDGLLKIRGRDVSGVRRRAVDSIRTAGLCCTLAVAVTRGVNDGELGDIVRFGIENLDVVRAINFQSATPFEGRFDIDAAYDAYGLEEILALIEAQSGVPADTFLSGPIGHAQCNAMSLVFLVDGELVPLFKYIRPEDLREFLGEDPRETILDAFAGKRAFFFRHLMNPQAWKLLSKAAPIFGASPNNVLKSRHILLFAKGFMDRDTLDKSRVHDCCYAITGEHGVVSFCVYNNLYRFA